MKAKKRSNKSRDILNLVAWVCIIVLINYIGSFVFQRFDLTSEKRFTLSDATIDQLESLEDIVYVRVYLEGPLPSEFKRLRDATEEMLDEFRAYSGKKIEYSFINPSESSDEKKRLEVYKDLTKQGLQYNNVRSKQGDKVSEQIIFPGAIFTYRGQEIPLQLLKDQAGANHEAMLNNSIQQLEYEISSTLRKLTRQKRQRIAFIEGHGEADAFEVADITKSLNEFYTVERVALNNQLKSLDDFDAIVIAKPDSAFDEKDKFIIDQFIMKGGKSLWLLDRVFASMDSLSTNSNTMGIPLDVNLDDQLFKYGVRINPNLALDLRALPIPIVTGYIGNQPRQEFFPWFYFPLITSESSHPIVKNLDAIKTEFVSVIDTVDKEEIKKTILLTTSQYTKLQSTPSRISLNTLREQPDERQFTKKNLPVGVLLEGEFESVFANRITPKIANARDIDFREKGVPNKMIVVSDGDIIVNRVNREQEQFYALGYDRYTNKVYGNKDFILNAINYLCDDSGLIEVRAKEFKIRLLDLTKIERERYFWQVLNTAIPILLVLIFGVIQFTIRKRKYTSK